MEYGAVIIRIKFKKPTKEKNQRELLHGRKKYARGTNTYRVPRTKCVGRGDIYKGGAGEGGGRRQAGWRQDPPELPRSVAFVKHGRG